MEAEVGEGPSIGGGGRALPTQQCGPLHLDGQREVKDQGWSGTLQPRKGRKKEQV